MNEDYCLWMGDIDPRMNEYSIQNIFQFYNVYPQTIKLIKDKNKNQNRNYCFIYFKNIIEANNTLTQLKGKPIPNTNLIFKLNWAKYHTSTIKTVYVGNLNPSIDGTSLFNFFKSKYKSVSKAKIITDNGISKRYGFVTFKKENDYRKSLIEMNGIFFEGTKIKVKEYKKKDEDENNNQENLKDNSDNQSELNNENTNNINNTERLLNKSNLISNNLNSNSFLTMLNSINTLNWKSNANPINGVNTSINYNNRVNINNYNNLFNQNILSDDYDINNNDINFNNDLNSNIHIKYNKNEINNNRKEYNNIYNNDINDTTNLNKNNNFTSNNKTNENKFNKNRKLEILEEFDEITLKVKINESLKKMLEYYKERYIINGSRVISKLILFNIYIVSNMFMYYCNESCLFAKNGLNEQTN